MNIKSPFTATELGDELDRAYQSINHSIGRKSKLKAYDFIKRELNNNKPYFSISEEGSSYINQK